MSTREYTYKYLSAGTAVRAAAPLDSDTRACGIYFFFLLSGINFATDLQ